MTARAIALLLELAEVLGVTPAEFAAAVQAREEEELAAGLASVCPGCHAVAEPCAPGCIDAAIAEERERDEEFRVCDECGAIGWYDYNCADCGLAEAGDEP